MVLFLPTPSIVSKLENAHIRIVVIICCLDKIKMEYKVLFEIYIYYLSSTLNVKDMERYNTQ